MTDVTREIMQMYKVDGIFSNRWDGSGMCYCEHCRQNFKKFSGLDLPQTNNPLDEARRQYIVWRQARLFELWRLWDGEIKKDQSAGQLHCERRWRGAQRFRYEDHRRARANVVCRSPSAAGFDAAVDERQKRQGIRRNTGPKSHRRHF
jgi:hypothetical protein